MRETRVLATAATTCLLLGLQTGCSEPELSLPTPGEINRLPSWVLWSKGALQASAGHALRRELRPDDERVDLVLLGYTQTLSELGLSEGTLAAGETCRACALLKPASRWSARFEGGSFPETWTWLEELPSSVASALVPDGARCDRCQPFVNINVPADEMPAGATRAAIVTPWADGALVAYDDGTVRRLAPNLPARPACIPSETFRPRTAYRATETALWVVDTLHHLWRLDLDRLDPDRGCVEAATESSTIAWASPALDQIDGPRSTASQEFIGVGQALPTDDATVSRYTLDGRTEVLGGLEGEYSDLSVAWATPGEAIAVNGSPVILRVRDGIAERQVVRRGGSELRAAVVIHDPSRGFLLGTGNSLVLVEDGQGGFTDLVKDGGFSQRVDALLPYGDSLVVGERNGSFRFYYDEVGYCPASAGFGGQALRHLIEGPGGELLGGTSALYYALPPTNDCDR